MYTYNDIYIIYIYISYITYIYIYKILYSSFASQLLATGNNAASLT